MSQAVLELLTDAAQRERLGISGRKTYERDFCWPAAWKTLEPSFESLIAARPIAAAV